MKIQDLLDLRVGCITIIVPNKIERKLLFDRFRIHCTNNLKLVNDNTININNTDINVLTFEDLSKYPPNTACCVVEFPESIPYKIIHKLQLKHKNFIITNEIK